MGDGEEKNSANLHNQGKGSEDNIAHRMQELQEQNDRPVETLAIWMERREYVPGSTEETQKDVIIEEVSQGVKEEDAIEGLEKGGKGKSQRGGRVTYASQV